MATTLQRNPNRSRPSKSAGAKAKRRRVQARRLVDLGMDQAAVDLMNSTEIRTMLKHPKKVAAANS